MAAAPPLRYRILLDPPPRIAISGGRIVYTATPAHWSWEIPVQDLRVLGEYTTDHGPFEDDYFFVFVTSADGGWYEASFYAEGWDVFLNDLGAYLRHDLRPGLGPSARFKSRVIWPPRLAGQELFDVVPESPSRNLLRRIRQSILPDVHLRFTAEVLREIGS